MQLHLPLYLQLLLVQASRAEVGSLICSVGVLGVVWIVFLEQFNNFHAEIAAAKIVVKYCLSVGKDIARNELFC